MCISCIGGTVDVSVHEVHSNGTLATISAPSGGHWGGTLVDKHMYDFFLVELFTQHVMDKFTRDCKVDKLDLDSFIEVKKRQVGLAGSDNVNVNMKLPNELIEIYNEMNPSSKFDTSVRAGKFSGSVQTKRDRFNITNRIFTDTFANSIEAIVRHLTTLLQTPLLADVKMLLMVGGYLTLRFSNML